ncbi:hypothetical protein SEEN4881_10787, partial [Salmonella enterica subsp. enterica serovar Newport str. WA_14881]
TGRVFAVVTGDGEIVGKDVLVPDAVIFLPVATCVFIYPPETDVGSEIFVVLAGQFAGFATGATTGINKNPYWVVIGYSLRLFNLNKITV